uniref:Uncharacterized protein n=1 Tax=Anopheles albimanus TaxID=7167 RepID=A0A182FVF6_ANOAL
MTVSIEQDCPGTGRGTEFSPPL